MRVSHDFKPVYDENSKILILGTMPSVKSREQGFYYGHPRNRFWALLACLFGENTPLQTIEQKIQFLHRNRVALWDVVESCDIHASSDASIKDVKANDISKILKCSKIERIFANGATAYKLYQKYCIKNTNREIILLPSTSPANAAFSFDRLVKVWEIIK